MQKEIIFKVKASCSNHCALKCKFNFVFKYIPQNLDNRDKLCSLNGLQLLPLSEQGTVNALKKVFGL
jgi:hypothetical protein